MPILEKIIVSDFRNIEFQEIDFSGNVNCISGNNGEGKTNLLDAIYYLSMTKSAFSSSDRFVMRHGASSFAVGGTYRMENGLVSRFSAEVSKSGEKRFRRDDKPYAKISEHIGVIPVVMVSPSDISLVSDSGEERRRFVNSVLSQMDREYLSSLQQYNRLLAQRNAMLKSPGVNRELLGVLDMRMAALSVPIHEARKRFAAEIAPSVARYYGMLSGEKEAVGIEYRSDLNDSDPLRVLSESAERDMAMKFTTSGIQRDDFIFLMDGYHIRKCGSQGQQKSFLVSLKFAQYDIMKGNYGYPPLMLLDDVFDKLDMDRVSNLLSMVSSSDFGQIFITDSNKVRMESIVGSFTSESAHYETVSGKYARL